MTKNTIVHIKKVQRIPNEINSKKVPSAHVIVKLLNKNQRQSWKKQETSNSLLMKILAYFSENIQERRQCWVYGPSLLHSFIFFILPFSLVYSQQALELFPFHVCCKQCITHFFLNNCHLQWCPCLYQTLLLSWRHWNSQHAKVVHAGVLRNQSHDSCAEMGTTCFSLLNVI